MSEFVEPDVERLQLSGENRWIDVHKELNAGQYDEMNAGVIKDLRAGETPTLDFQKVASYKILAYVVNWSFIDSNGKSVPVSAASIANLKKRTRNEIAKLVEAHDAKSEQEIEERKNGSEPSTPAI